MAARMAPGTSRRGATELVRAHGLKAFGSSFSELIAPHGHRFPIDDSDEAIRQSRGTRV